MKSVKFLVLSLFLYISIDVIAQSDTLKWAVKFNVDANSLLKGDGLNINYFGLEKGISKKSALLFWVGYDFHSSNLIINDQDDVVSTQYYKMKIDYRRYIFSSKNLSGVYLFPSVAYDFDLASEGNQKHNQIGVYLGLGYQKIWNRIVFDFMIDKGYSYSILKNDDIEFVTSKIVPFNLTLSIGFKF